MTQTFVRIAVIGAGSAGLAQIKQCLDAFRRPEVKHRLELVAFEPRSDVGGLWNYDEAPKPFQTVFAGDNVFTFPAKGDDPTPLYEGLVATLPFELMAYRDLTFPSDTNPIPTAAQIGGYLREYATTFDLRSHIRFQTRCTRLQYGTSRRWRVDADGPDGHVSEEYDFVSVANGHYADPWIPEMPNISRASDYIGKTVLVVGSFSSGSDITRLLAGLNLKGQRTTVYQSSSGIGNSSVANDPNEPWRPYIHAVPLISHFEADGQKGRIHFRSVPFSHESLDDVDVVIFATGYYNSLPFCKASDEPWRSHRLLEEDITIREGGDETELGGLRGLHMQGMDEMLLFLANDRSIAFPGLPYQIVPFPFAEVQARLVALYWAGLVDIPLNHSRPPNIANVFHSVPTGQTVDADGPIRFSIQARKEYIFPNPYEWSYTEDIFKLLRNVDSGEEIPSYWKKVEPWRKVLRADVGMRKRLLGY